MADSSIISATDNDRLCECCKFVINVRCENIYHPHHQSEAALERSAADCPLCFTIWLAYSEKKYDRGAGGGMRFVSFKFSLLDGSRELDMLKGRSARSIKFHFRAEYSNYQPPHDMEQDISREESEEVALTNIIAVPAKPEEEPTLRASSGNTGSKETWSIISRWLHQCALSHLECKGPNIPKWMPARVVNVGTSRSPTLHLHITHSDSIVSPYAALSHCWGGVQNMKQLREENLHSMTNEINLNELPRTFRDAITVTRRIGLQYLWIDSLCIIQNSHEDWTRESSKMREVYKHCLVNISATAAPNGDSGCFFPRNPARARTCRVIIERVTKGKMRARSRAFDLFPRYIWNDSIYKEPLAKRGWVVQEQFLAPRIIHFSRYQVFWECQQLNACEMFPNGIPCNMRGGWRTSLLSYYQRNRLMLNLAKVETEFVSSKIVDAYALWIMAIRLYTRCHLTKERDKLVAVSAIAREIQPIIQDEYLAGLWRRYLPIQLLWSVHHPPAGDRNPTRYEHYCAPSWSWASLNANIEADIDTIKEGKDFMIRILEARVDVTNSDIFGQVSAGYLRIKGWVRGFFIEDNTNFPWSLHVPGGGLVTAIFDESPNSRVGLWYCLPIVEGLDYRKRLKITGLILEKAENNNIYRRAGIFHASSRYPGDKRPNEFRRPSYSSKEIPIKEKASRISDSSRSKRRKLSKVVEADGIIATFPLPLFKWEAVAKDFRLINTTRETIFQVGIDSRDWFFFPDSHSNQDQLPARSILQDSTGASEIRSLLTTDPQERTRKPFHPQLLDEKNFPMANKTCRRASKPTFGSDMLSVESDADKCSRKRQREGELKDFNVNTTTHHFGNNTGSSSVSSEEFSDDSNDDTDDDEAIEELTIEEQEAKMKKEWVECIITII